MQTSDVNTQTGRGGAWKVCLPVCLAGVLGLWAAQESLSDYWQAHYQRLSPLAALDGFAPWDAGAQVYDSGLRWRDGAAAQLQKLAQSIFPTSFASAPDGDGLPEAGEPLLLAAVDDGAGLAGIVDMALPAPQLPESMPEAALPQADAMPEEAAAPADGDGVDVAAGASVGRGNAPVVLLAQQHEVFFAGDSMMEGVAPHIAQWLKKQGVRSTNRSIKSTGLTNPNAKTRDWPAEVENALRNARTKLVVVFLGPNDPWDMRVPGSKRFLRYASPEWEAEYRSRIRRILDAAESKGARVIWMGMPPMRKATLNEQMVYLDGVMRSEVGTRAIYVPTRPLLSSPKGGYADRVTVDGRVIGVRAKDGVHFTPAGQRLLARAVQAHIRIMPAKAAAAAPAHLAAASAPSLPASKQTAPSAPASTPLAAASQPAPLPTLPALPPQPAIKVAAAPSATATALPMLGADGTLTLAAHHEVLFAGDSMMENLAPHVAQWLRARGIKSRNRSRFSTGLTNPSAQTRDWPAEVEKALAANERLKLVVMFLGPNDPLDMPDPAAQGKRFLRFTSPEWEAEYRRRIARILDAVESHGAQLIWIGLPVMRVTRYERKMAYIDSLFRSETEGRALYLPIRELLSDGGAYADSLLLHGKKTRVRASDGVHMSAAGTRLIAHAVQQRIRIAAGTPAGAAATAATPAASAVQRTALAQ